METSGDHAETAAFRLPRPTGQRRSGRIPAPRADRGDTIEPSSTYTAHPPSSG